MFLTKEEEKMLNGAEGSGRQKSMEHLVKMGEAFGAERMIPVESVHIHCAWPLDYLEELTAEAHTNIFATTHANPDPNEIDPEGCKRIGIPEKYDIYELLRAGAPLSKVLDIFKRMGYYLTHTCTPFYAGNIPRVKSVFSWCGTSGQVLMNSWFGAYGQRGSVAEAVAMSVTGRAPLMGFAVKEKRYAQVLARVEGLDLDEFSDADWGALGYYLGAVAGPRTIVIDGLPKWLSLDQFRFVASALPVSGAVGICHVLGLTPEASTLEEALGGKKPEIEVKVGPAEIEDAIGKLNTAGSEDVDLVTFGCPHCSLGELRRIAEAIGDRKVDQNVRLLIAAYRGVWKVAESMGYVDIIKKSGGVLTDCCVGSQHPFSTLGPGLGVYTSATNSTRMGHYIYRISNHKLKVLYGSLEDCIEAAITGKWRAK